MKTWNEKPETTEHEMRNRMIEWIDKEQLRFFFLVKYLSFINVRI